MEFYYFIYIYMYMYIYVYVYIYVYIYSCICNFQLRPNHTTGRACHGGLAVLHVEG